ncbi:hypothetical protein GCM10010149_31020 [Nonomuraea roseoviolacea subsp. roseoviolacea]|uniref:Orotate phosphoribosyltransferase n=1 Tax=Nonomuraea roseoviolacea subsp. carminata TaxID=160689 RepID=A0ABT1K437_9ACTN|nr:hypothetical protein [Nonomuraea roseoviolacea]MCP2348369.1 orotate phosphoribosyltransferase [Nonomuraea roseoviolacea subsp. carminata]
MVVIGFTLLGVGLGVALLLALADPVLLSRINGEHAEGGSGRHIEMPREGARVLRLAKQERDDRHEPAAA